MPGEAGWSSRTCCGGRSCRTRTARSGLFGNSQVALIVLALVVLGVFAFAFRDAVSASALVRIAFGVIVGGAIGNIVDRFHHDWVVDFIDFKPIWGNVFNVADRASRSAWRCWCWCRCAARGTPDALVDDAEAGTRLTFSLARLTGFSRSHVAAALRAGAATVNGAAGKPGALLEPGDRVDYAIDAPRGSRPSPKRSRSTSSTRTTTCWWSTSRREW